MLGTDRVGIAGAQTQKLPTAGFVLGVIDLVDDEEDGASAPQRPARGVRVLIHHPGRHVDDQEHQVGRRQRRLGLLGHLGLERVARFEPAAGIHDIERDATPFDLDGLAIARHAAVLFHDRHALAGETVDEGALADVRSAHYHDLWFHARTRPARTDVSAERRS